jgi:hypothetical protein
MNATRSAHSRSFSVKNKPCGAPAWMIKIDSVAG